MNPFRPGSSHNIQPTTPKRKSSPPKSHKKAGTSSKNTIASPKKKKLEVEGKTLKLLGNLETLKHPLSLPGYLNPVGAVDKEKKKVRTKRTDARDDDDFFPVVWTYIPISEDDDIVPPHDDDNSAGKGIHHRFGPLRKELACSYVHLTARVGTTRSGQRPTSSHYPYTDWTL
ncbi:uncharacterized protein LOC110852867 [Folsomia candida]|uniref:uncharacterized protein LOC110852867 n=1 Tax=Folsomia candida TaxID=158441 RepID=UPI000B8F183D|nr:uncharacterized protein LOC110852867 [Folsomia candida]